MLRSSPCWAWNIAIIAMVAPFTTSQGIDSRYLLPVYVPLLFVAAFWLDGRLRSEVSGRMSVVRWTLVAFVLIGGSWHIGVSVRQNLRLTAEAQESGYIGKESQHRVLGRIRARGTCPGEPVSGQHYSNDPKVLRGNVGVPGTSVTWVPVPRRNLQGIYDCQVWFERAILKSRQHGEPEAHVVWVGQSERVSPPTRRSYLDNPAIHSEFDVYIVENIYVKEPCSQEDVAATFFLHLDPVDVNDLPDYRRRYGFDNLDFHVDRRGVIFEGKCMVTIPLPSYVITGIRTGPYVPVEGGSNNMWEARPEQRPLCRQRSRPLERFSRKVV